MVIMNNKLVFILVAILSIYTKNILAKEMAHDGNYLKKLVVAWLDVNDKQKHALVQLSIMRNRGELKDLPNKKFIFEKLITNSKNIYFLYDSVAFLAKFSKDDELLGQCKRNIVDKSHNQNVLIASLTYVSVHDSTAFEQYFNNKDYLNIQEEIRTVFAGYSVIRQKRDLFLTDVIVNQDSKKQQSVNKQIYMDEPDSVYLLLMKEAAFIPDFVNRNKKLLMTPALSPQLQILLGEIHSFESFDILLENYIVEPNYRSAMTLACCIGSLQVEKLFRTLESEHLLDAFLRETLGNTPEDFWIKIKDLPLEEKKDFFLKNYQRILILVRERAKNNRG